MKLFTVYHKLDTTVQNIEVERGAFFDQSAVRNASTYAVIGPKTAGVKGINLKDDYVVSSCCIDDNVEYLNVFTNYNTAKRVRISDLIPISRAKKGNMIFRKVKTKNYLIVNAYPTDSRTINIMKCDSEITEIKNADIPIMDAQSIGGQLTKQKVDEFKPKFDVINSSNNNDVLENNEIIEDKEGQISFDDFVNDFKI